MEVLRHRGRCSVNGHHKNTVSDFPEMVTAIFPTPPHILLEPRHCPIKRWSLCSLLLKLDGLLWLHWPTEYGGSDAWRLLILGHKTSFSFRLSLLSLLSLEPWASMLAIWLLEVPTLKSLCSKMFQRMVLRGPSCQPSVTEPRCQTWEWVLRGL